MDKISARRLEHYNATPKEQMALLGIALKVDKVVGNDVYYSIVTGISFEELDKVNRVPTSKTNFYRMRNQTMEEFGNYLAEWDKDPQIN